jgi:hypothetical protein
VRQIPIADTSISKKWGVSQTVLKLFSFCQLPEHERSHRGTSQKAAGNLILWGLEHVADRPTSDEPLKDRLADTYPFRGRRRSMGILRMMIAATEVFSLRSQFSRAGVFLLVLRGDFLQISADFG